MPSLIFTKSYSNLRLSILFIVLIIGGISVLYWDKIPDEFIGKATFLIISVPFILIYLFLEIRKISRYPNDLTIDAQQQIISVDSKKTCAFKNIKSMIITLKKYDYELYLKDNSGEILIKTSDYYNANMGESDIREYLTKFTNIQVINNNN